MNGKEDDYEIADANTIFDNNYDNNLVEETAIPIALQVPAGGDKIYNVPVCLTFLY